MLLLLVANSSQQVSTCTNVLFTLDHLVLEPKHWTKTFGFSLGFELSKSKQEHSFLAANIHWRNACSYHHMLLCVYFSLILVSGNRNRQRVLASVTDNRNIAKVEGSLDNNQQYFQETWNINRKFLVVALARTQLKLRTRADNKTTSSNFCYRQ